MVVNPGQGRLARESASFPGGRPNITSGEWIWSLDYGVHEKEERFQMMVGDPTEPADGLDVAGEAERPLE